jgi:hypothetical protein
MVHLLCPATPHPKFFRHHGAEVTFWIRRRCGRRGQNRDAFEAVRQADLTIWRQIGWRLAVANAALCDRLEPGLGIQLHTLDQFDRPPARCGAGSISIRDFGRGRGGVSGSPAERAGLKTIRWCASDRSTSPHCRESRTTQRLVAAQLAIAALPPSRRSKCRRFGPARRSRSLLQPVPACRTRFELLLEEGYNARADGTMVQISSQFLEEYTARNRSPPRSRTNSRTTSSTTATGWRRAAWISDCSPDSAPM